ncbi:MoxR family ATPase [Verrucomicrobiaceae bacterium N1E253]|uniref:MoxR family ATPase n=1 Tax=Oceaniferula marina TaxID=2748318 RepID=A0A851GIW3_9BACT|nr:MoxR family ATPase [Oceaniferula marina]NWK55135.1 MoxR family ATPase [Oceaniferula marina]
MSALQSIQQLQSRVNQSIIGQEHIVERLVLALLANGNVLMEGLPGLAKTRAIKALASNLESDFSRIQFTPDLLPADITGSDMYFEESGHGSFRFQPGPIFGNLILADEVNRAPAKVQAALLEAMEERTVTVGDNTHNLPDLFMVLATQNPVEQEGTYPLPEAQMDRFLMHVNISYTSEDDEIQIIRLVRGEKTHGGTPSEDKQIPQQSVFDARQEIDAVSVAENMDRYIVDLITATRHPDRYGEELGSLIDVGASPRGSLAIDKCARAHAWLHERDYVTPDDITAVAYDCLRHRIMPSYEAQADGMTATDILQQLIPRIAVA